MEELLWLDSLAVAVKRAESHDDLLAIDHEYSVKTARSPKTARDAGRSENAGSPGKPASKSRRRGKAYVESRRKSNSRKAGEAPFPPRSFISSDGFVIFAGRNNFQNESLLRKARKDDWWFHVRHMPGSHVIIATEGKMCRLRHLRKLPVSPFGIREPGTGGPAEVDYCRVRDVKSPPARCPVALFTVNTKRSTRLLDPAHLRKQPT